MSEQLWSDDLQGRIAELEAENARLIAAAPDLLQACEELTDCMDIWQGEGTLPPEWEEPLRMAVQAIEKAKGAQNE